MAFTPGVAAAKSKGLPASLAKFAHCPVNAPGVATCLYSSTTSTTFDIGSTTVTSSSPTTLSLGLSYISDQAVAVLPTDGTQALQSPAIPLPGGLTGISGLDGGDLAVTVTPQLVGLPTVDLGNLLNASAPGLTLPLDVLVSTPTGLLGPDCTIGDAADPITLNLTTGTTNPPSPNTPITGAPGTLSSTPKGLITITDMTLVDNSFAVPGTDNCGTDGILDPVLDLDKSLPSAAGSNTAILSGSSYTAPAKLIRKYLG
ncbi:MAG: hypothetical protein WBG41_08075 [Acidimicrobiales bacterium]